VCCVLYVVCCMLCVVLCIVCCVLYVVCSFCFCFDFILQLQIICEPLLLPDSLLTDISPNWGGEKVKTIGQAVSFRACESECFYCL